MRPAVRRAKCHRCSICSFTEHHIPVPTLSYSPFSVVFFISFSAITFHSGGRREFPGWPIKGLRVSFTPFREEIGLGSFYKEITGLLPHLFFPSISLRMALLCPREVLQIRKILLATFSVCEILHASLSYTSILGQRDNIFFLLNSLDAATAAKISFSSSALKKKVLMVSCGEAYAAFGNSTK